MGRSNPWAWGDLDQMWRVGRYGGHNHMCNIWWLSVKGCGTVGVVRGVNLPSPIDFTRRPLNTGVMWCDDTIRYDTTPYDMNVWLIVSEPETREVENVSETEVNSEQLQLQSRSELFHNKCDNELSDWFWKVLKHTLSLSNETAIIRHIEVLWVFTSTT